jgi:hypothetical protein
MALPTLPKKAPRTESLTVKVSKAAWDTLTKLADAHHMSKPDVIEYLLFQEANAAKAVNGKSGKNG